MILAQNHPPLLNGNNFCNLLLMKIGKTGLALLCFLFLGNFLGAQSPESFDKHRVRKGETLNQILERYQISEAQFLEYNPLVERIGIQKRMVLRIPVYLLLTPVERKLTKKTPDETQNFITHLVTEKETKWRLAYQYGTTIVILDSLNPNIIEGLKIGQQIKVPQVDFLNIIPKNDIIHNYYKVLPKEGFYRIEKKLGVNQSVLDSLNPTLRLTGLLEGMILKIPGSQSGKLKIENDLLVERINLLDSTIQIRKIKLGVLLPFKANEIVFDSVQDTQTALSSRNLHTISLDFYSGVRYATIQAAQKGIDIEIKTFDTENNQNTLQKIVQSGELDDVDLIIGPLIPNNFNFISNQSSLKNISKISPLSSNPIIKRENVFQSVTQKSDFRIKMIQFLGTRIDSTHNLIIVTDSLNRKMEKQFKQQFPWAIILRPEKADYILPELVDSLLIDSIPNKIILETQSFPLIASAISQFNSQNRLEREVQVFTSYRSNAYDNENLSRKVLGGVKFTYPVGFKPLDFDKNQNFINAFIKEFGKPPNKEAIRGYDVVMDGIFRIAIAEDLESSLKFGETEYISSRFSYIKEANQSFSNNSIYILQHDQYEIIEIKE